MTKEEFIHSYVLNTTSSRSLYDRSILMTNGVSRTPLINADCHQAEMIWDDMMRWVENP